jgi:hypothetical protein
MPPGKRYTHQQYINRIADLYEVSTQEARSILESDAPLENLQRVDPSSNPAGAQVPGDSAGTKSQPDPQELTKEPDTNATGDQDPATPGMFGRMRNAANNVATGVKDMVTKPGGIDRIVGGAAMLPVRNWKTIAGLGTLYGLYNMGKQASDDTKGWLNNTGMLNAPGVATDPTPSWGAVPPRPEPINNGLTIRDLMGMQKPEQGQPFMPPQPMQGVSIESMMPNPAGVQQPPADTKKQPKMQENKT